MTETQISAVLGCSPGAVKAHASRGLDRLRKTLAMTQGWQLGTKYGCS